MSRILRGVAFAVLSPLWLLLGLLALVSLLVMAIPVSIRGFFRQRQSIRALRAAGRVRTAAQILEKGEGGTIIVDQPGWGGRRKSCWWSPDDLESIAPMAITSLADRMDAFQFESRGGSTDESLDRWLYERYLSEESGTAYLVSTRNGDQIARALTGKLAALKIVESWSAPYSEFRPSIAGSGGGERRDDEAGSPPADI